MWFPGAVEMSLNFVGALEQVPVEMARAGVGVVLAVLILSCATGARADGSDHKYKEGDHVPLYANKVGPFHNPRYVQALFLRGLLKKIDILASLCCAMFSSF
jgi:hypothetical protein